MSYYIQTETNVYKVVSETDKVYRVIGKHNGKIYSKSKCQTKVIMKTQDFENLIDLYLVYIKGELAPHVFRENEIENYAKFVSLYEPEEIDNVLGVAVSGRNFITFCEYDWRKEEWRML